MLPIRNIQNGENNNKYSTKKRPNNDIETIVYNSSASNNKYLSTFKISNNPRLTNNYAPMKKQLINTIGTYQQHPTAKYVDDSIPFFNNIGSNMETIHNITVDVTNVLNDWTKRDVNQIKTFNDTYTTQTTLLNEEMKDIATNTFKKRKLNSEFIDKLMFKYSNINDIHNEERRNHGQTDANRTSLTYRNVETFKTANTNIVDDNYLLTLESIITAVLHYLKNNKQFEHWKKNWQLMENCLTKNGLTFERLDETDVDIAYVVNKGETKSFRIRGEDFKYVPLNIYQYVLFHEAAHLANPKYGHGDEFCELLSVICLAAFQCGFVNLDKMSAKIYLTNNQPILCKSDMKYELLNGIKNVRKYNEDTETLKYLDALEKIINV